MYGLMLGTLGTVSPAIDEQQNEVLEIHILPSKADQFSSYQANAQIG
jgi:hypothetical protein